MRFRLRSAALSIASLTAYLLGSLVLPAVHQTLHRDDDHFHLGDTIVYLSPAAASETVGSHHHYRSHQSELEPEHDDQPVAEGMATGDAGRQAGTAAHRSSRRQEHGAGSIFHFGIASGDALDRTVTLDWSDISAPLSPYQAGSPELARDGEVQRLRGPPVSALS